MITRLDWSHLPSSKSHCMQEIVLHLAMMMFYCHAWFTRGQLKAEPWLVTGPWVIPCELEKSLRVMAHHSSEGSAAGHLFIFSQTEPSQITWCWQYIYVYIYIYTVGWFYKPTACQKGTHLPHLPGNPYNVTRPHHGHGSDPYRQLQAPDRLDPLGHPALHLPAACRSHRVWKAFGSSWHSPLAERREWDIKDHESIY